MSDQIVKKHIETLLQHENYIDNAREAILRGYEAKGYRIVDGGQTDHDTWEVKDYRTGETIVQGGGGIDGYLETVGSDQGKMWVDIDPLTEDLYDEPEPVTEGLPESLCEALSNWVSTADSEDIAEFIDWPVERVEAATGL